MYNNVTKILVRVFSDPLLAYGLVWAIMLSFGAIGQPPGYSTNETEESLSTKIWERIISYMNVSYMDWSVVSYMYNYKLIR